MIGKKIRGFKFEDTKYCSYHPIMSVHIGEIGVIIAYSEVICLVEFKHSSWNYPKDLCLQHLVEDKSTIPSHYQTSTNMDVIDFCSEYKLNFNRGSAVKYIARAGKKDDEIADIKKAIDFLQRELKKLEI